MLNIKEAQKKYRSTKKGRANKLCHAYKQLDKKNNRGECTLTPTWITDNILSKPCCYCGETDWNKIGCNRLDNNLPHTPDNVEPCCRECNLKLVNKETKQVYQYTKDGELVNIWPSIMECKRNGYTQSTISLCCNGLLKSHKGYKWSFQPL